MEIKFSKRFVKQLAKQPPKIQKAFYLRLKLFEEDPHNELLRNHKLMGEYAGMSSINVGGDVRAIYEIINNKVYLYQFIGTHSQLYG